MTTMATSKDAVIWVGKGSRGGYVARTHIHQLRSVTTRKSLRKAMADAEAIKVKLIAWGYQTVEIVQV
jgi:hypothetical protein